MASGRYPIRLAAARTFRTISGLAERPVSAREAEASETPAAAATSCSVGLDPMVLLIEWIRFQASHGNVSILADRRAQRM